MEIILIKDVEKLGFANDIVDVKPGYANNFLIPQGIAKRATESAKKILAENIKQQAHKESKKVADAEAIVAKLNEVSLTISAKAEEGRIFGSITSADIADALKAKGFDVDKKAVTVDAVKVVGEYKAIVGVYKAIKAEVNFSVVAAE